jgi:hypothetical protein
MSLTRVTSHSRNEQLWGQHPSACQQRGPTVIHAVSAMWVRSAVGGPLIENVGRLDENVGLRRRLLPDNLVPFWFCLWAQALRFVVHYNYR